MSPASNRFIGWHFYAVYYRKFYVRVESSYQLETDIFFSPKFLVKTGICFLPDFLSRQFTLHFFFDVCWAKVFASKPAQQSLYQSWKVIFTWYKRFLLFCHLPLNVIEQQTISSEKCEHWKNAFNVDSLVIGDTNSLCYWN